MDEPLISNAESLSPEDAVLLLEAMAQAMEKMKNEQEEAESALAAEIEGKLRLRMSQRSQKENEWTRSQDLYMGKLSSGIYRRVFPADPEKEAQKEKLRVNIIRPKVKTAVSQLVSSQFGGGEKNWNLLPSKVPQTVGGVDPVTAVKLMEDEIEDQLEETDYVREIKAAMYNCLILGTAVVKGPLNVGRMRKVWEPVLAEDGMSVIRVPRMTTEHVPCIKSVDPWMFYPDMTVRKIDDAEDAIEIHAMSKRDLLKLRSHKGYKAEQIEKILQEDNKDFIASSHAPPYSFLNSDLFKDKYLVWEYHGRIDRSCLCKMGIDLPMDEDPVESFWGEVWGSAGKIIRIDLANLETACSVPYAVDTWEEDPSSIFGFGLPLINEDQQRVAEGMWDVIVDNAKISSGPQVVLDKTSIEPSKDGAWNLEPWKVWLNKGFTSASQAMQFAEVPNRQQELTNVLEMAKAFADEEAAIPLLAGGMDAPNLASGATGLALVAKASTSVLHEKSAQWDDNITSKVIGWMYDWNMQYNPKEDIKGDFEVDVRTTTSYLRQHMESINLEKLIAQASQNPDLNKVIKLDEAARALVANMQLPSNRLVRNEKEVQAWEQQQQQNQQPDPALLKLEVDKQALEIEKMKLQLEAQKLQWEREDGMQRAQMEYQAKQEANDARVIESQAKVQGEQLKKEQEYIQFATRTRMDKAKLDAEIAMKLRAQSAQEFVDGAKLELDANKQRLTERELNLAEKTGEGI